MSSHSSRCINIKRMQCLSSQFRPSSSNARQWCLLLVRVKVHRHRKHSPARASGTKRIDGSGGEVRPEGREDGADAIDIPPLLPVALLVLL
jgi:hypothetical protein